MLNVESAVKDYFKILGFEPEVAAIYLTLQAEGPQHITSLSRLSGVERTKIYRLIDVLMEAELIEVTTEGTRGIMQAAPIANVRALLARRQTELTALHSNLELLEHALKRHEVSDPTTHVRLYADSTGIRTMLKSSLPTEQATLHALCTEPIEQWVGSTFMQEWATLCIQNGLSLRVLYTPNAHELLLAWRKQHKSAPQISSEWRIIQPDVLTPTNNLLIWANRVAFVERSRTTVYATMIENSAITHLQRTHFDTLWQRSEHA